MIEREVYNEGALVITRCSGTVSAQELIDSAHWMVDNYDKALKPDFSQIFDALEANTDAVTEEDIHRIAHINIHRGHGRGGYTMAILAMKPYPQALAKLHKLLSVASDIRVEIFCDYEQAYKWLGVKDPTV